MNDSIYSVFSQIECHKYILELIYIDKTPIEDRPSTQFTKEKIIDLKNRGNNRNVIELMTELVERFDNLVDPNDSEKFNDYIKTYNKLESMLSAEK